MKSLMENEQLDVAGFEFVADETGKHYCYDINTNTNYNTDAENRCGKFAMQRLAEYLGSKFYAHYDDKLIMAG